MTSREPRASNQFIIKQYTNTNMVLFCKPQQLYYLQVCVSSFTDASLWLLLLLCPQWVSHHTHITQYYTTTTADDWHVLPPQHYLKTPPLQGYSKQQQYQGCWHQYSQPISPPSQHTHSSQVPSSRHIMLSTRRLSLGKRRRTVTPPPFYLAASVDFLVKQIAISPGQVQFKESFDKFRQVKKLL